jgi:peptidoglycan/LPS O-acetylase OafA/YrhL
LYRRATVPTRIQTAATTIRGAQPRRFFQVEALRGLASLSVAWFHMTNTYTWDAVRYSGAYGWLGVEVFFVISGFIIPYSLYAADYRVSQFHRFMARRIVRLEPPYIVSILVTIALWHLSALSPGFAGSGPNYSAGQVAAHLLYLIPFTPYDWLNVVYWTLFYEFLFYVSAGLLYPVIARGPILAVCAAFAVTPVASVTFGSGPRAEIFLFLIGIAGFRYFIRTDGLATFLFVATAAAAAIIYFGAPSMAAAGLATIGIILFVEIPNWKALGFMGSISYSLYLMHVPIGGRVVNLARRLGSGTLFEFSISLVALVVCIATAALYWYWLERPAQLASKRISLTPARSSAAAMWRKG